VIAEASAEAFSLCSRSRVRRATRATADACGKTTKEQATATADPPLREGMTTANQKDENREARSMAAEKGEGWDIRCLI